jgi:hypothetical protein
MKNEYVILCKSHQDLTPTGIVISRDGKITLQTNNTGLFNSLSAVCNDKYESWGRHLASGSPLASLYKGGYTPMSEAGDPSNEQDQRHIATALEELSPLKYDETLYAGKW